MDDFDILGAHLDAKTIKGQIEEFLKQTYGDLSNAEISRKPNKDGLYIVDWKSDLLIKNRKIEQLTNGLFEFGEVNGKFNCNSCQNLKTLKGSPKIVYGNFNCGYCSSLKSLKGGPQKVGGVFDFSACSSLTSLEGAPKQCEEVVSWCMLKGRDAITFKSLKGCPQAQKITLDYIKGIKNLKGLPKKGVQELFLYNMPDLESLDGGPAESECDCHYYNCEKLKSLTVE